MVKISVDLQVYTYKNMGSTLVAYLSCAKRELDRTLSCRLARVRLYQQAQKATKYNSTDRLFTDFD